jgi:uncharacterized membrane-anchored protein YhcB (DUF1043 family)
MKHDTTPPTKGDLSELEAKLMRRMDAQKTEIMGHMEAQKTEILRHMAADKEETMRHFDVVAENLFHDLAGAHRDEIQVLKDRKDDHERRIRRLERAVGTVAA